MPPDAVVDDEPVAPLDVGIDADLPAPGAPTATAGWHTHSLPELTALLDVDPNTGITEAEAARRRSKFGPNRIERGKDRPRWQLFLDQFRNLLVLILLVGAAVAAAVGDLKDAVAIGFVLVLNAIMGYVHERRAQRGVNALQELLTPMARVRRDGAETQVPSVDLVPGDIVVLLSGDRVPADGRIVDAWSAEVDESVLTGESFPAPKHATEVVPADAPLGDRANCVFMDTEVTRGRMVIVITSTGMGTEVGRVAELVNTGAPDETPLQRQLDGLGRRLAVLSFVVVAFYFGLGVARGSQWSEMLLSSVALLVAAIPEGLPAVVTLTLALGTGRLVRGGALVKRLSSVETLGSTTVILTDKTGTLTTNHMAVRAAATFDGGPQATGGEGAEDLGGAGPRAALEALARLVVLCNDSVTSSDGTIGEPTEKALIAFAHDQGLDSHAVKSSFPRIAEIPFDPARKYMVTFHVDPARPDEALVVAKGAWDVLGQQCSRARASQGAISLDPRGRRRMDDHARQLAQRGLRVLAVASHTVATAAVDAANGRGIEALLTLADDLELTGLLGLMDPPRPEVRDAIARCRRAGIAVKMVTGDHVDTAQAVATELGIPGDAIDGRALDGLDDGELAARIDEIGIVARVAPQHKVRLVRVLRDRGEITAMTGDGVNDAPALTAADLGVAMGASGTDVAREAADLVLIDDNFATITRAVEEGRTLYDNILEFVRFQVATNIGALATFVGAELAGLPTPFTPIQVLWINLIMDGPPAMALGLDPGSPDVMERQPRRPDEHILGQGRLVRLVVTGLIMATGTLLILAWGLQRYDEARALTLAFTTFILFQLANALNVRDETATVFRRETATNVRLWLALAGVLGLQVLAVYADPVQQIFGTVGFSISDWLVAVTAASSLIAFEELRKVFRRRRLGGTIDADGATGDDRHPSSGGADPIRVVG